MSTSIVRYINPFTSLQPNPLYSAPVLFQPISLCKKVLRCMYIFRPSSVLLGVVLLLVVLLGDRLLLFGSVPGRDFKLLPPFHALSVPDLTRPDRQDLNGEDRQDPNGEDRQINPVPGPGPGSNPDPNSVPKAKKSRWTGLAGVVWRLGAWRRPGHLNP